MRTPTEDEKPLFEGEHVCEMCGKRATLQASKASQWTRISDSADSPHAFYVCPDCLQGYPTPYPRIKMLMNWQVALARLVEIMQGREKRT